MTAMTPHGYPIAVPKQGSVALAKWQPFTAPAVRQSLGDSATRQPSEPGQVVAETRGVSGMICLNVDVCFYPTLSHRVIMKNTYVSTCSAYFTVARTYIIYINLHVGTYANHHVHLRYHRITILIHPYHHKFITSIDESPEEPLDSVLEEDEEDSGAQPICPRLSHPGRGARCPTLEGQSLMGNHAETT